MDVSLLPIYSSKHTIGIVYCTRKNAQVNKSVHKLSTSCVRTACF